jgi:hypothetical protein
MKTPYYECHVTVKAKFAGTRGSGMVEKKTMRGIVEDNGWSFSEITDDPVLGPGAKLYATAHFDTDIKVRKVQKETVAMVDKLKAGGMHVVRHKIECVILDEVSE